MDLGTCSFMAFCCHLILFCYHWFEINNLRSSVKFNTYSIITKSKKLDIDLIISSAAPSVPTPTKSPQMPVNSHFFGKHCSTIAEAYYHFGDYELVTEIRGSNSYNEKDLKA